MNKDNLVERAKKWSMTIVLKNIYDAKCNNLKHNSAPPYNVDNEGFVGMANHSLVAFVPYCSQKSDKIKNMIIDIENEGLIESKIVSYYNEERFQNEFIYAYRLTNKGISVLTNLNAI